MYNSGFPEAQRGALFFLLPLQGCFDSPLLSYHDSSLSTALVLTQVPPDTGIFNKAMAILNSFVNDIF